MAKRIFAVVIAAVFATVPLHQTFAESASYEVDGCAKLARVIYAEVSAAAMYGTDRAGPWSLDTGSDELSICETTAKTVSQAFTSAMASAGIDVTWHRNSTRNGDFCWSGILSQCYPDRERLGFSALGSDEDVVRKSWSIVSQAVMREMYNPYSSDEVRFRDGELQLRLGLSLRSVRTDQHRY